MASYGVGMLWCPHTYQWEAEGLAQACWSLCWVPDVSHADLWAAYMEPPLSSCALALTVPEEELAGACSVCPVPQSSQRLGAQGKEAF